MLDRGVVHLGSRLLASSFLVGGRGEARGSIVSRLARTRKQSLHVTGFVSMLFVIVVFLIV